MMVSQVTVDRTGRPRAFHIHQLLQSAVRGCEPWCQFGGKSLFPVVRRTVPYIPGFRFDSMSHILVHKVPQDLGQA